MTIEQRNEIFAKESLSISDFMIMFDNISYGEAAEMIREIKRNGHDRLHKQGKIHVQDYIDYYRLDVARYSLKEVATQ